jgi:hypothetical protein
MSETHGSDVPEPPKTLYELAGEEMQRLIAIYLRLLEETNGLASVAASDVAGVDERRIILAGLGALEDAEAVDGAFVAQEVQRRSAVPFDVESGITTGVYRVLRERVSRQIESLADETDGFRRIDAGYVEAHPHLLPMFMRIGGVFSKAELKKIVGSASDQRVGKVAATKLSELVSRQVGSAQALTPGEVLRGMEATLEGIVRDLVGRLLLESLVENALKAKGLTYKRESEYEALVGVVYDFRADFVLPDETHPEVFIEVRKSSSRHASLYAKDKMFSAINWKGRHPGLMGVLVTDGEWTGATLRVLPTVFDYVVPITQLPMLADILRAYIDGDKTKLKWLINFSIEANSQTEIRLSRSKSARPNGSGES